MVYGPWSTVLTPESIVYTPHFTVYIQFTMRPGGDTEVQARKILGSSPSHAERPLWEWASHIIPSSYTTSTNLRMANCLSDKTIFRSTWFCSLLNLIQTTTTQFGCRQLFGKLANTNLLYVFGRQQIWGEPEWWLQIQSQIFASLGAFILIGFRLRS